MHDCGALFLFFSFIYMRFDMEQKLLDMGLHLIHIHEKGELYRTDCKSLFITIHSNEILVYYKDGNPKAYRYKKLDRNDIQGVQKYVSQTSISR